jgi:hypothetical protein
MFRKIVTAVIIVPLAAVIVAGGLAALRAPLLLCVVAGAMTAAILRAVVP